MANFNSRKKRILLNNILWCGFGQQRRGNKVEFAIKMYGGETKETIEAQTKLFHDRILPTLDNNIKSGNSLIDLDYYDNELNFGERAIKKKFVNVFNRDSWN